MISAIHEKISHLSNELTARKSKHTLKVKNKIITEKQKILHNNAVVPIDKSSGNAAFVCKRHYVQVLINELCLNNVNNITLTYMKAIKPVDKTLSDHTSFLKKQI